MALYKVTMIFQGTSAISSPNAAVHRTGGWSESVYMTPLAGQVPIQVPQFGQVNLGGVVLPLLPARANMLPLGYGIVGLRLQAINPTGPSQSIGVNYPGVTEADVPQMALLAKVPSVGANNIRRMILRGIPDAYITEGEFTPNLAYQAALFQFFASLGGYQFRGRDLSQPSFRIVKISPTAGTAAAVTFEANVPYQLLQFVRILKSKDATGNLRGGRAQVTVLGGAGNLITIDPWPFGPTVGGSARLDGVVYPTIDAGNIALSRVVVKRVGRPPIGYRGRRSRRR